MYNQGQTCYRCERARTTLQDEIDGIVSRAREEMAAPAGPKGMAARAAAYAATLHQAMILLRAMDGTLVTSVHRLVRDTGISEVTVKRGLRLLKADGRIEFSGHTNVGGWGRRTVWKVNDIRGRAGGVSGAKKI